ncbi:uncharacterized protein [Nicotiana tomentosiformis]|uniref:uncharacterized protein n=1 Tax=Nicotiana tomentosiformis TaxID=4098 RepID=UPI00388C7F73
MQASNEWSRGGRKQEYQGNTEEDGKQPQAMAREVTICLIGYRTTVRTSTGETSYLLVYGTEAVIPAEVEIPSLRIIQEAELSYAEWIRSRYEQLALIDGKRMNAVCHGKLYQNRMSRAFNERVTPRQFPPGQLVLKRIFLHQDEAKGKFLTNWQGPYMVHRVIQEVTILLTGAIFAPVSI